MKVETLSLQTVDRSVISWQDKFFTCKPARWREIIDENVKGIT